MKTFNQLVTDYLTISRDDSSANETLGKQMMNDNIKTILNLEDWVFNRGTATDLTEAGRQYYPIPYNCQTIRKIKVNVNNTVYSLREIKSEAEWERLNMVSNSSDVPTAFFVKPSTREFGIYPIPSTDGYTITINFKKRVIDYGADDYSEGTVTITSGESEITGSGTSWTSAMVGRYIKITNYWYEITKVTDATHLTIRGEFGEDTVSGGNYVIAEIVPLLEGSENAPLYFALARYFDSREDRAQADKYDALYEKAISDLYKSDEKTTSDVLYQSLRESINPNDYPELS